MTNIFKNSPAYFLFTSKEYRLFLRLWGQYGNVARYSPRSIPFGKYKFFVPDCASFIGQHREIFFEEIYKFTATHPHPVIYDCGANIGMSCLYFKKLYPHAKIKAFEADPEIFKVLKQNLADNNIQNVELFNKAVWISDDKIQFGADGADGGSSYQQKGRSIRVEGIRLKSLLEQEERVDLLKIDIEGTEVDVIADCAPILMKVTNLFIEYHSWNNQEQHLGQILNILKENEFRYYFQTINQSKTPFINKRRDTDMDFQLNIFAYRGLSSAQ